MLDYFVAAFLYLSEFSVAVVLFSSITLYELFGADLWGSKHEQPPLPVSLLRPALSSPFNMELHI